MKLNTFLILIGNLCLYQTQTKAHIAAPIDLGKVQ